eukprot:TRINITY_DN71004_c0_g1_i1.p1 TRINITY_DN71004_c0_g1~~TRINITY_DN71004_c0_g1_i1.p1  ORF type:complete len:240 (-),score=51.40 TRINITY_DN71004_c0_g1_i1:46-765(-)
MGCRCGKAKDGANETAGEAATATEEVATKLGVKVHVGPLEIGSDGVVIKPKFNVGVTGNGVYALAGLSDVRDGVLLEGLAMAMKSYTTSGQSLVELLQNIKDVDDHPELDKLVKVVPDIIAMVIEQIDVDISSKSTELEGVVYVYAGVGVTAGVFLGWVDTKGFRMVGARGAVAAGVGINITLIAGVHESRRAVRVVCYLANVGFDIIARLKEDAPLPEEGAAPGASPEEPSGPEMKTE